MDREKTRQLYGYPPVYPDVVADIKEKELMTEVKTEQLTVGCHAALNYAEKHEWLWLLTVVYGNGEQHVAWITPEGKSVFMNFDKENNFVSVG
jgi:hypothetical protein